MAAGNDLPPYQTILSNKALTGSNPLLMMNMLPPDMSGSHSDARRNVSVVRFSIK